VGCLIDASAETTSGIKLTAAPAKLTTSSTKLTISLGLTGSVHRRLGAIGRAEPDRVDADSPVNRLLGSV
jgi:hypothetical protein